MISGPALGAAQILIWSYFSMFMPPMSIAIRTSVFSFLGALNVRLKVKRLPAMRETQVQSLGWEDPLEKEMATHSSTLA